MTAQPSPADTAYALKPAQVAERLSCSPRTVYDMVKAGKLRGVRLGGELRIPYPALVAYLNGDTAEKPTRRSTRAG